MRPPHKWISSAPISIWAMAMVCRVIASPRSQWIKASGRAMMPPPKKKAAQTC